MRELSGQGGVQPGHLQAETAAYPELRLVVMMHGDRISYAENFEEALSGLFEESVGAVDPELGGETQSLAIEANDAFENYLRLQAEERFEEAARELQRLSDLLKRMSRESVN